MNQQGERAPSSERHVGVRAGEHELVIAACDIVEVAPRRRCVPVPSAPGWIAGAIEAGGRLCAVVDAGLVVAPPRPGRSPPAHVVVLRASGAPAGAAMLGLSVEAVLGVLEATQLEPAPAQGHEHPWASLGRGWTSANEVQRPILDVEALVERVSQLQSARSR